MTSIPLQAQTIFSSKFSQNRVQGLFMRVGAPLIRKAALDRPIPRLQPELLVGGQIYIMLTQHLLSIPASDLREPITSLVDSDYRITSALDLLFHGV